jgi:hypothetical protein
MRIDNIRREDALDRARVAATVRWEDCDRGIQDVYVEVPAQFGAGVAPNADAFVIAGLLPAMHHGERRLAVCGDVCPRLMSGLKDVMQLLSVWYGYSHPVTIESKNRFGCAPRAIPRKRAAFFFTGGVDSLTTLRVNRTQFAPEHSEYFRDGLLIFGLEVEQLDAFQYVIDGLTDLANESDISLIPIYTNIRSLDEDWVFWADQFESSVLASVAHTLHRRLFSASIASTHDYRSLHPHGSHPLLDSSYSTANLQIRHDGASLSRLEKMRILAKWERGLKSLRVCNRSVTYRPGLLNCGQCEKCLRTLTALMVLDKLDSADSFASREVTADLVRDCLEITRINYPYWAELVGPLEAKGFVQISRVIRAAIRYFETKGGWKQAVVRFDRQFFDGVLLRMRNNLLRATASCSAAMLGELCFQHSAMAASRLLSM